MGICLYSCNGLITHPGSPAMYPKDSLSQNFEVKLARWPN